MIEITPRAIDQASNRVRGLWQATRNSGLPGEEPEGFYSWLRRMAGEALDKGEHMESGKIRYLGMKMSIIPCSFSQRPGSTAPVRTWHMLQSIERIR